MGKKGIFEYVNLQKQELVSSKTGNPYIRYVVVSDTPNELKNLEYKLRGMGFSKGFDSASKKSIMFAFANNMKPEMVTALKSLNDELKNAGGQTGEVDTFLSKLNELKAEIEASTIPLKTKTELDLKLEQYIEDIANGVDDNTANAKLQQFIEFSNKFHSYSYKNIILIYIQKPDATKVAARSVWRNVGREVTDLNKAITINCGNKYYHDSRGKEQEYTLRQQNDDTRYEKMVQSGQERLNPTKMDDIRRRRSYHRIGFAACPVFDISDTVGNDLPQEPKWSASNDNNADAEVLFNIAKKSLKNIGINVTQDPATAGESGWSRSGQINVSQSTTGSNAAATIFKEWASDLLYNTTNISRDTDFGQKALKYLEDKGDLTNAEVKLIKAVQSEAISAALCKYYGLPANPVVDKYASLTQANNGMDIKQIIKENLSTITDASNYIIKQIEKNRGEFEPNAAQQGQQVAQQQV